MKATNENNCTIAGSINITITGISNSANNFISLSPNPAGNELRIKNAELRIEKIEIYNVIGMNVYSNKLQTSNLSEGVRSPSDKQETVIDVSTLSQGIYFVQVVSENRRWVGRFVKE